MSHKSLNSKSLKAEYLQTSWTRSTPLSFPCVKAAPTRSWRRESFKKYELSRRSCSGVSFQLILMAQEGTAKLNSVQSAAILFYPSHFSVLWLGVRRRSPPMAALGWASHGPIAPRGSLFSFALLFSHTSRIIDSYRLSSENQLFYTLTSANSVGSEEIKVIFVLSC